MDIIRPVVLALCLFLLLFPTTSSAQDTAAIPELVKDHGYNFHEENNVVPDIPTLTTEVFGDKIDPASGSISFEQVDISIPGNSTLPVEFRRTLSDPESWYRETLELENWSISLPHVRSVYVTDRNGDFKNAYWPNGEACTAALNRNPNFSKIIEGQTYRTYDSFYFNGDTVNIPGKGSARLTNKPGDNTYKRYNNLNWDVSCITNMPDHEGFKVVTGDGVIYEFTVPRVVRSIKPHNLQPDIGLRECGLGNPEVPLHCIAATVGPSDPVPTAQYHQYHMFMMVSRVSDRFGNYVDYAYGPNGRLENITANDGRTIDIRYTGERVSSVIAMGKTWRYRYDDEAVNTLAEVELPDSRKWVFSHHKTGAYSMWKSIDAVSSHVQAMHGIQCARGQDQTFIEITHPHGLRGEFVIGDICHGQSEVPKIRRPNPQRRPYDTYWIPSDSNLFSLTTKTLTFTNGDTYRWRYRYSSNAGHFSGDAIAAGMRVSLNVAGVETAHLKSTTTLMPDGSKSVQYFERRFGPSNGNLMYSEIYSPSAELLKRSSYAYQQGMDHGNPQIYHAVMTALDPFDGDDLFNGHSAKASQLMSSDRSTYFFAEGEDTYTLSYSDFDQYDQYRELNEQNSFNNFTRTAEFTYHQDPAHGLFGLPKTIDLSENGATSARIAETVYYASDHAYKSLPRQLKQLGRWYKQFDSYHLTGAQAGLAKKVSFNAPGRWVEFSDYKRGKAQTVKLPKPQAEGNMSARLEVSDEGWITKITDFKTECTGYDYDAMGRLKLVDPCDPRWTNTSITYVNTTSQNNPANVHSGMLKQTITRGAYRKTSYLDNLLRPVLSKEEDSTLANSARFSRTGYDYASRSVFASFPSASATTSHGSVNVFDALGRERESYDTTSNKKVLTHYLHGNRVEVTNQRGYKTTMAFHAFGAPSRDKPLSISSPESVLTQIVYGAFGNPVSISQGEITEARVYDDYGQLCKTQRPDVGKRAYRYNALNQMQWSAYGNSINDDPMCDFEVEATAKTTYHYNPLGDIGRVIYGDATPDKILSYDANGELNKIEHGSVVLDKDFNSLGLIELETLSIGAKVLRLDPGYNAAGSLTSLKYPSGRTINYSVNALGEISAVSPYITDVSYHPNGQANVITYGNGLTYAVGQNSRQLPESFLLRRNGDGETLASETLDYDDNNNVKTISNLLDDAYNISLTYDGLDRLKTASGFWGDGRFDYDALGNIRNKRVGSQQLTYHYDDIRNILDSVTGSKAYDFAYDSRGNVVNNGFRGFEFDAENRVTSSDGINFIYDGNDRRVAKTKSNQTSYFFYDHQGKVIYQQKPNGDHLDYVYLNGRLLMTLESL